MCCYLLDDHLIKICQLLTTSNKFLVLVASNLPKEANNFKSPVYSSMIGSHETNSDLHTMFFGDDQFGMPLEGDMGLTVSHEQKFTIQDISPEWGFTTEATKVCLRLSRFYYLFRMSSC